ncbi:hypothetical protein F7725_024629, partial [Dissostichus mawsoni]
MRQFPWRRGLATGQRSAGRSPMMHLGEAAARLILTNDEDDDEEAGLCWFHKPKKRPGGSKETRQVSTGFPSVTMKTVTMSSVGSSLRTVTMSSVGSSLRTVTMSSVGSSLRTVTMSSVGSSLRVLVLTPQRTPGFIIPSRSPLHFLSPRRSPDHRRLLSDPDEEDDDDDEERHHILPHVEKDLPRPSPRFLLPRPLTPRPRFLRPRPPQRLRIRTYRRAPPCRCLTWRSGAAIEPCTRRRESLFHRRHPEAPPQIVLPPQVEAPPPHIEAPPPALVLVRWSVLTLYTEYTEYTDRTHHASYQTVLFLRTRDESCPCTLCTLYTEYTDRTHHVSYQTVLFLRTRDESCPCTLCTLYTEYTDRTHH